MLCTVETDIGLTGVGEGGTKTCSTVRRQLDRKESIRDREDSAAHVHRLVLPAGPGEDPRPGRARLALWDIKGKALQLPLYDLLHGAVRNHVSAMRRRSGRQARRRRDGEPVRPLCRRRRAPAAAVAERQCGAALRERARAAMEAGYRCFRVDA